MPVSRRRIESVVLVVRRLARQQPAAPAPIMMISCVSLRLSGEAMLDTQYVLIGFQAAK